MIARKTQVAMEASVIAEFDNAMLNAFRLASISMRSNKKLGPKLMLIAMKMNMQLTGVWESIELEDNLCQEIRELEIKKDQAINMFELPTVESSSKVVSLRKTTKQQYSGMTIHKLCEVCIRENGPSTFREIGQITGRSSQLRSIGMILSQKKKQFIQLSGRQNLVSGSRKWSLK